MLSKLILFFLENKLITLLLLVTFILWGVISSPFAWNKGILPNDPIPVDAIPDIGENQQIVYTEWPGRSPQDIDDQISYPLTTALLGLPGVKTIRSNSIFGLSSIYIIFEDDVEFYWSRSRILEKINALPGGLLPKGVTPSLGPDATALGQIFWYTLEGRDIHGNPNGGWDPQDLRSIQDYTVQYALASVSGVAEVASIGGFVKEYQIDLDPNAMRAYGVTVSQIIAAVKSGNLDIGAGTLEFNRAEYLIRALGYIKSIEDLEKCVVKFEADVPIRLKDVAHINIGPASRRGGLDKDGVEAVGGVIVARYGANPLEVINRLKDKIREISPGLPSKVLPDGTKSTVSIIPFYDRTILINETLGTLEEALTLEMIISIIVVIILVLSLRASLLISGILPAGVLMTFIIMRRFDIDANIVALSGIAIAIGVMVDLGIVFTENIMQHLAAARDKNPDKQTMLTHIHQAASEIAPAALTAVLTTVISFLPIFALQAAEGKLFKPLAFTKTFAMLSALALGMFVIPPLAHLLFSVKISRDKTKKFTGVILILTGLASLFLVKIIIGLALIAIGVNNLFGQSWDKKYPKIQKYFNTAVVLITTLSLLSETWMPLGAQAGKVLNLVFTGFIISIILAVLMVVIVYYKSLLTWCLLNKRKFLTFPITLLLAGILAWQGFDSLFGFMPSIVKETRIWQMADHTFPGLGKEFMPALNEGSFLLMPTTMPHSGVEENLDVIRQLDSRVASIPEVENVVGKWGRVNSALDPAPISMFENLINYKPEFILNEKGYRLKFKTNDNGSFILRDGSTYNPDTDPFRVVEKEDLIEDDGAYFRQWRKHIHTPDDIWQEIVKKTDIPGLTSAPKLQPIQTRLVMLQTGMRAPMGIKVFGQDLESIGQAGLALENQIKEVEGVNPLTVFADRIVGKPYLEIRINRDKITRYGLTIQDFQTQISSLIGGLPLTTTVEGRERYPVRLRYAREFRENPDDLMKVLISLPNHSSIPLSELAEIEYRKGPQAIKSENSFLVGYVIFDKKEGYAEIDVIEHARDHLKNSIQSGLLKLPPGINYTFTGSYENQIRATNRLAIIIPVSLLLIILILYFQFRSMVISSFIFSGILIALSGGFILIWLFNQGWFLDINIYSLSIRELFNIRTINMSVAVWVGFIALFGIATDDGVLISTYLQQLFKKEKPGTVKEIQDTIIKAGSKRIRPAMMTTATTIIALLPVLSSRGKGSDIMIPMAIPIVGGMIVASLTVFIVPVLYSFWQERKIISSQKLEGLNYEK